MTPKPIKLDIPDTADYRVAGIASGFRNFRVCFEVNKVLELNLTRVEDVTIPAGRPGSQTVHAFYNGAFDEDHPCYLVANKDKRGSGSLIPELKTFDYFLIVYSTISKEQFRIIMDKLRQIDIISGIYEIDPEEIKSSEAFVILLES